MNWRRLTARALDTAMCALMSTIQRRHRLDAGSREALIQYIEACAALSRDEYYRPAPAEIIAVHDSGPNALTWASPVASGYAENDRAFALHFPAPGSERAPTVLFLHALMSASDRGYRRWAARFNAAGWSACFLVFHLPYHYFARPARLSQWRIGHHCRHSCVMPRDCGKESPNCGN